jgi:hypothetical protein
MESLRFFSNVPPGGSNVSLSGTTLTIEDETHTLADPTTVASHTTAINDLQTNEATNTSAIATLDSRITQNETNINNLEIVTANPTATATTDLTKLTVGPTTFFVGSLPYIELYRTTSLAYYNTNHAIIKTDLWEGHTTSDPNMSLNTTTGQVTVPAGTYLAIFHCMFLRSASVSSSYYQTGAGMQINGTAPFNKLFDENAKEGGLSSSRAIYGNVQFQRIITVNTNDDVRFLINVYYLSITLHQGMYAQLIKIR